MIISFFGSSCTGKSTLARPLAKYLGLPLRSCGEEIKQRAKAIGSSIDDMPISEHLLIDEETIKWASDNCCCIIEGRYLNYVLSSHKHGIILVQLTASATARRNRMALRVGKEVSLDEICEIDRKDQAFRVLNYKSLLPLDPTFTIDTSLLTVNECLELIKTKLKPLL
ncbi:cytidylate kinase-related protein [Citrifermentans bemidjiense Bem]|uniref:Cytidylate kinase-related protein n=1 Tax=Citrifermentans bemidjiense (strain ATCC BAA-1014 / DSM 16622 / JCM 12645 / Bem) TaxID=404380 RepID=E1P667_CITBB|nr:cytidylate kinase-related protein [Citrifermentans bemidjiense Bem]